MCTVSFCVCNSQNNATCPSPKDTYIVIPRTAKVSGNKGDGDLPVKISARCVHVRRVGLVVLAITEVLKLEEGGRKEKQCEAWSLRRGSEKCSLASFEGGQGI